MFLSNVRCPYCKEIDDIDYEPDGAPSDGDIITVSCPNCKMNFCGSLDVSFSLLFETVAPCQNDGEHEWEEIKSFPDLDKVNKQCKNCGDIDCQRDPEKVKAYIESLNLPKTKIDTMGNQTFENKPNNLEFTRQYSDNLKSLEQFSERPAPPKPQTPAVFPVEITRVSDSKGNVSTIIDTRKVFE